MPSSIPPRRVVCDNDACVHVGLVRQVHPIRIGIDLFTYPPAYCACATGIELRTATGPDDLDAQVALPELGQLPQDYAYGRGGPVTDLLLVAQGVALRGPHSDPAPAVIPEIGARIWDSEGRVVATVTGVRHTPFPTGGEFRVTYQQDPPVPERVR